ncbi:hypothetical protein WMF31_34550 [Sorangium sp. So ce1036]|uniref:hypothetical protein n=1 Tax=Sorangium sp. So ce1036 TaxID=3133328 RepID=UPI003F05BABE
MQRPAYPPPRRPAKRATIPAGAGRAAPARRRASGAGGAASLAGAGAPASLVTERARFC